MKDVNYKIYTLGCKVNQYDSALISQVLQSYGFCKVNRDADLAIINTCAVTQKAISKDKRMINRARRENPKAKIIVFGCWPRVYSGLIKLDNVDYILGAGEFDKLFKIIKIIYKVKKKLNLPDIVATDRTRYFLKIQDGCEQFCTYCIIPLARGKLKSRPAKKIIKEAKNAIKHNYKEIVLTGIHLGLYGKKGRGNFKYDLADLIKKILVLPGLGRLRLSSIEITEIDDKIINLLKKEKKLCPHLHIPLQSGSDKILKLMNRPYTKDYFKKQVNRIRKVVPDIAISTDIIVGFPGETDQDFKETCRFTREIGFSRIHVFSFSAHPMTLAFHFPDKVKSEVISKRSKILRSIGEKLEESFKNKFKNKTLEVFVERQGNNYLIGRSEYYFEVKFKPDNIVDNIVDNYQNKHYNNLINKIVAVKF